MKSMNEQYDIIANQQEGFDAAKIKRQVRVADTEQQNVVDDAHTDEKSSVSLSSLVLVVRCGDICRATGNKIHDNQTVA